MVLPRLTSDFVHRRVLLLLLGDYLVSQPHILPLAMSYRSAFYVSLLRTTVRATPLLSTLGNLDESYKDIPERGSAEFYWHIGISLFLVLAGGVFSGLTLGLMGLDELHLRVLESSSDTPRQRQDASKVLSLLARGRHWVLVVSDFCYPLLYVAILNWNVKGSSVG